MKILHFELWRCRNLRDKGELIGNAGVSSSSLIESITTPSASVGELRKVQLKDFSGTPIGMIHIEVVNQADVLMNDVRNI
jgi:hypothetical protein